MQKIQYKKVKSNFGKYEEIPIEWDSKCLSEVVNFRQGLQIAKVERFTESGPNRIKLIKVVDFNSTKGSNEYITIPSKKSVICNRDDIIIARTGTLGLVLTNVEGVFHNNTFAIDYNRAIFDKLFFYYYLQSPNVQQFIKIISTRTSQGDLTHNEFSKLIVFIPPHSEQIKIASIISNVDELILKTEQIIEQTQKLKKGLMQRLLTKGIGHTRFKKVALSRLNVSKLTQIPHEWEIKKLKDITVINPESINEKYPHKEINYIEIGAINNYEIHEYVIHKLSKRPSRAQRVVRKGDIIVSTVRPYLRGFTLITDFKPNLICSTGFAVIRPKNKEDEYFIFNYIKSKLFEDNIFRQMEGMAYPAITSSDVANAIIPYSNDKREIMKIGSLLYSIDSNLKLKYSYKIEFEYLKKGLMQQLLTGKIRG